MEVTGKVYGVPVTMLSPVPPGPLGDLAEQAIRAEPFRDLGFALANSSARTGLTSGEVCSIGWLLGQRCRVEHFRGPFRIGPTDTESGDEQADSEDDHEPQVAPARGRRQPPVPLGARNFEIVLQGRFAPPWGRKIGVWAAGAACQLPVDPDLSMVLSACRLVWW